MRQADSNAANKEETTAFRTFAFRDRYFPSHLRILMKRILIGIDEAFIKTLMFSVSALFSMTEKI